MHYTLRGTSHRKRKLMYPSDEELIRKAVKNDKGAFTELVTRYKDKILGYLYRYVGNYHMAEDLTVETFKSAYDALRKYREEGKFSSWLYRIATNCARMELRKKVHKFELSMQRLNEEGDEVRLSDLVADERERPDYSARETELKEFIYKAVATLDKKYKDVLLLCDVEGMSLKEVAKTLKSSVPTVGTQLRRAREMLYNKLRSYGYEL